MALNLGVTSCQSLEISLDQFVRGEVLEGSNAYYCEKCKEKVWTKFVLPKSVYQKIWKHTYLQCAYVFTREPQ